MSASAFGLTVFGNPAQKGSLLIFPIIDVTPIDDNVSAQTAQVGERVSIDTLITIVNDSSAAVRLKCYYATSQTTTGNIPTPFSGGAKSYKHFMDFTIDVTHNQPFTFEASSGEIEGNSAMAAGQYAPPFGFYPDGFVFPRGELKCWAVTDDGATEKSYNHLFGKAAIVNAATGQAWEYAAWAFQAFAPTGTALGTPGELHLDNVEYDACPNMLLGSFFPASPPIQPDDDGDINPDTAVYLASCNQDLRQNFTPTITKLTWTFWNQDEQARTGTHFCADSWFETTFPAASWIQATYAGLGTNTAYFRIETTADTSICSGAVTSAYVGVMRERFGTVLTRGVNLTGRGPATGLIKYDVSPGDSFRPN